MYSIVTCSAVLISHCNLCPVLRIFHIHDFPSSILVIKYRLFHELYFRDNVKSCMHSI